MRNTYPPTRVLVGCLSVLVGASGCPSLFDLSSTSSSGGEEEPATRSAEDEPREASPEELAECREALAAAKEALGHPRRGPYGSEQNPFGNAHRQINHARAFKATPKAVEATYREAFLTAVQTGADGSWAATLVGRASAARKKKAWEAVERDLVMASWLTRKLAPELRDYLEERYGASVAAISLPMPPGR